MITNVHMLTANPVKFEIARGFFGQAGVPLIQLDMDAPEIQSMDVEEVARVAAMAAVKEHNVPVFKTDVGFYFDALKGFPGPFIKFVHPVLSVDDWINLMRGKPNKNVNIREALVIAFPDGKSVTFIDDLPTTFTDKPSGDESAPTIDRVLIPSGFDRAIACYTTDEQMTRWKNNQTIYTRAAKYIKDMT